MQRVTLSTFPSFIVCHNLDTLYIYFKTILHFLYQTVKKMACQLKLRKQRDWWRERDSNPRCPFRNIHDFQSCSFNHSDISPKKLTRFFYKRVNETFQKSLTLTTYKISEVVSRSSCATSIISSI